MDGLGIAEMQTALRSGEVTAVQLTTSALTRAHQATIDFKAFSTLSKNALIDAAKSDQRLRENLGRPLEGIPVGVKDLIDTSGVETVYGSEAYIGNVPTQDADVVRVLREQGAVVIGKTTTHEFAWGVTTSSFKFGDTLNPIDPTRIPGGSSGGAAVAIACGAVAAGLGTDTGGSVRIPAALCGVVGFKPTFGKLPTEGIFALAPSLDHPGILGAAVADVAILAEAFGIRQAPTRQGNQRIGVVNYIQPVPLDQHVSLAFNEALLTLERAFELTKLNAEDLFEGVFAAFAGIVLAEGGMVHFERSSQATINSKYGQETYDRLERAKVVVLADYINWQQTRRDFRTRLEATFANLDFLILPTTPCVAPLVGQAEITVGPWTGSVREALMTYTAPFNMAGYPAISLPLPVHSGAMPCGLQIIGRPGLDVALLAVAQRIETIFKNGK